jgi:acyl-CoA thioesterase-1
MRAFGGLVLFTVIHLAGFAANAQVVCLGASHTRGQGVASTDAFPAQLQVMLRAKGYTGQVANQGISGDTTAGMLSRLDAAVPPGTRVVILQPGGNDARHGNPADRDSNISQIVEKLKNRQIQVIMLENSMLGQLREYHQADGEHLTPEGYRLLASRLLPQILQALGLPG